MMDPGDLPRFPKDPRSGAPLHDWPFFLENAEPRWTTESVRVGWVPPNRSRNLPTEPSQSRESNETVREEPPQEPPTGGSAGSQSPDVRPIHRHLQQEQRWAGAAAPTFPPLPTRTSSSMSSPVDPVAQPRREVAAAILFGATVGLSKREEGDPRAKRQIEERVRGSYVSPGSSL